MEDKQNLCLYCFEPSDTQICPHCGGDASAAVPINQLSPGTMLAGRILVGRAVGPEIFDIIEVLGVEQTCQRIVWAVETVRR